MPKERFYCDELGFEIGTVAPFKLMQLGRVQCANCHTQIGMYVKSSNGKANNWLKQRVLFEEDCVTFQYSNIRFVLN